MHCSEDGYTMISVTKAMAYRVNISYSLQHGTLHST